MTQAATGHDFLHRPMSVVDPEIADAIALETTRQNDTLELIASENHVSHAVLTAMGSVFTNKYAEGYPSTRTCSRTPGRRPINRSTSPCSSRATRSWAWTSRTAAISPTATRFRTAA